MQLKKISRALISVSDKTNLEKLLQTLQTFNTEIISTGGTYQFIKDKGFNCTEISHYTGFPEPKYYHTNRIRNAEIPLYFMRF